MNYSLNRYLEKVIDLLEMSPLENQFQDFIVYPILDGIIHESKVCEIDLVDCHNFRQYNTQGHDRRRYSVLVKAVPDLLVAKDFFYNNRDDKIYNALNVIASIEIKEPNNTWMLDRILRVEGTNDKSKEYKDDLFLELLPSLIKNRKVILTNIRKWEFFDIDRIKDEKLLEAILVYMAAIELCGFDSFTDYEPSMENPRIKILKSNVIRERIDKLNKIQEIKDIVKQIEFKGKESFDELVKKLDKKYIYQIKEIVRKAHVHTWNIINTKGELNVDRYNFSNDNSITSVCDIDYSLNEWDELLAGLTQFINENT